MLDVPGMPCLPHLHDQVLIFAIIGTGIPLGQFSCSKTLADSRLQMAAAMLPREKGLGAKPLGGSTPAHPLRSRHLSPLHSEKAEPSGASDAAVAPSQTGKSRHGQGIGNDPHASTVAKKAEDAAAHALAAELKAMRADKAKAQMEADATYAG